MLATVGLDATSGAYRFTFNEPELGDGIEFVVLVIGLFSVSEAIIILEHQGRGMTVVRELGRMTARMSDVVKSMGATLRGSFIGFVVGVLPGTGASVSYTTEKRISDREGTFGKGDVRGLASPEAANNATAAGGLVASLFVGNFILLALNLPLVNIFARVLTVPNWLLVPGILVLSVIGVYSTHASVFSIFLMLAIGFAGRRWIEQEHSRRALQRIGHRVGS